MVLQVDRNLGGLAQLREHSLEVREGANPRRLRIFEGLGRYRVTRLEHTARIREMRGLVSVGVVREESIVRLSISFVNIDVPKGNFCVVFV